MIVASQVLFGNRSLRLFGESYALVTLRHVKNKNQFRLKRT